MYTINAYDWTSYNTALTVCKIQPNGNLATVRNTMERDLFYSWGLNNGVARFWVASRPSCYCVGWWCSGYRCDTFDWNNVGTLPYEGVVKGGFWCSGGSYPEYSTTSSCDSCAVYLDTRSGTNCLRNDDVVSLYICEIGIIFYQI